MHDPVEIFHFAFEFGRKAGLVRASCHLTPRFCEPNSPRIKVHSEGFSDNWLELYKNADFRSKDPIPHRTLKYGTLLKWTDAMTLEPNTDDNREFFSAMKEFGLVHGFGIPLYGSNGRETFASMDFGRPLYEINSQVIADLRSVASTAHQRICVLFDQNHQAPHLSDREKEVLIWVSRGKSVSSIATILGLSAETVKTYSKRLYEKFGVADRVSLVLKATKFGLLRS